MSGRARAGDAHGDARPRRDRSALAAVRREVELKYSCRSVSWYFVPRMFKSTPCNLQPATVHPATASTRRASRARSLTLLAASNYSERKLSSPPKVRRMYPSSRLIASRTKAPSNLLLKLLRAGTGGAFGLATGSAQSTSAQDKLESVDTAFSPPDARARGDPRGGSCPGVKRGNRNNNPLTSYISLHIRFC